MRTAKWILFGYLALSLAIVVALAVSLVESSPRRSDTLYLPLSGGIKTLDPAEVSDTVGAPLVGQVYEALFNYAYGVYPYQIVPELAAEMPDVSPDGLTMTIKLKKGIHFHDPRKEVFADGTGPEVKAFDVIYTFKRICDFNLASPNYSAVFQGSIVGLDDWWGYTQKTPENQIDWSRPVEGFQIVDDYTIRLKMTAPNPQMICHLAFEPTGIVCKQAVDYYGTSFRRNPVGTGPFMITENLRSQRIVYEANPDYRGSPLVDGLHPIDKNSPDYMPHIKRVQFDFFQEQLPIWLLFQQGMFDALGDIPKDSFNEAVDAKTGDLNPSLKKRGVTLRKITEPTLDYIGFNLQDPVLKKNRPLRQAMSLAFNRALYIQNFRNGRGLPAIGLIPPGVPTYDPNEKNPYTQFDLDKARELMKEAVRINGGPIPQMTLLMRDADTLSQQMAEFFSSQMRQIGVDLQPVYRDWARYQQMVDNRQTQVFDSGWQGDYPDPQNFFQLFYSKNIPDAGLNGCCYNNPEFDKLYEEATTLNPTTAERRAHRDELYRRMNRLLMEDCPAIWEFYDERYVLSYDWLGDMKWMDYGYGFRQHITLDGALRKKEFSQGVFQR